MIEKLKNSKVASFCEKVLFPIVLFIYPLIHVCYGVEWNDTGYNYANFVYMENIDPMWKFSTYLANAVGNFLTHLPFGDRMLGLNVYTGLTVCFLALAGYYFFVKKIGIPAWITFVGEVIAVGLCWCPTALLYNYLTYILMFVAAVCLYQAMTTERKLMFVAAGIALGLNVFVRFSNLAQIAFIVGVWTFAVISKKRFKEIAAWTGWCVLGFLIGFGGFFLFLSVRYGGGEYISAILRLFGMSEEASSYSVMSMVESQVRNYLQNFIWMGYMVPFMAVGFIGFAVLPKHLVKLKKVGYVFCMALVFYWLRNQNMYNFTYTTIMSVFQWAVCLLSMALIMGVYVIFSKKTTGQEKLLCGLTILIALLTPLGSNNHLNASINNLFFGAPVILWMLWKLIRRIPEKKVFEVKGKKLYLFSYPFKALVAMIVVMLLLQSLLFGSTFVFVESGGGKNLHTKVENSDILKGMYTDEYHSENLEEITQYVTDNNLKGKEVILYGYIPSLSYYLEMPFAISSWPDLSSYNYSVMCEDMDEIGAKTRAGEEAPVIILAAEYGSYLMGEDVAEEEEKIKNDKKFALVVKFAKDFEYELKFANEKFMLFEAAN